MKRTPRVLPVEDERCAQHPAVQALRRLAQEPEAGLNALMEQPGIFADWLSPIPERGSMKSWHAQAWQAMAQDAHLFHRWLGWWGDQWAQHVVLEAAPDDALNQVLFDMLPMEVWTRPSPALPNDRPWPAPVLDFWRRLAQHNAGWFEQRALGSLSSQYHELDGLGYNPHQDTVTNVLGVAVAHGHTHAINAWTALGASWYVIPKGLKSYTISPLLVALTKPDAADQPAVQGLGHEAKRWGQVWGHANTSKNQGQAWKPAWMMPTARGTVWDVAVQHPDGRVREQALRSLMAMRPASQAGLVARSGLPEASWRAHRNAAEALVLRDALDDQNDRSTTMAPPVVLSRRRL